jgi:hypothetical protein
VAEGGDTRHDIALRGKFMEAAVAHAELLGAVDGGDHQHGDGIGIGLAHGGEDVGHAGAGDDEADTRLAAHPRIAIGHEAGPLFVARCHVADAGCGKAAVELDRVHAGDAEDKLDAIGLEKLHQPFATGCRARGRQAGGRHDQLSPGKSGDYEEDRALPGRLLQYRIRHVHFDAARYEGAVMTRAPACWPI